jgi:hypothetical protein
LADERQLGTGPQAALVVLYGSGLLAFARSQHAAGVWVLLVPALFSLLFRLPTGFARGRAFLEDTARGAAGLAVLLGFVWTLYPFLPASVLDVGPLLLGYALAALAALFLLGSSTWAPVRTAIPVCLALLIVGTLAQTARPPILPAGLAALALAAWAVLSERTLGSAALPASPFVRIGRLAAFLAIAGALGIGIVRFLPWAQPFVERASVALVEERIAARSAVGASSSTLGAIEKLALSQRVMLRVHALTPQKLRAAVFTRFDGHTWSGGPATARALTPVGMPPGDLAAWASAIPGSLWAVPGAEVALAVQGGAIRSRLVLASFEAGPLVAPRGTLLVQMEGKTAVDARGILAGSASAAEIYGLVNRRDLRDEPEDDLGEMLSLPPDTDPRLRELAARLGASAPSPRERLARTLQHLDRECRYALDVGSFHSAQPVAEFLFEKKRGYCEYFASAAAVLLRLQGVPTRYVTGWNVRDENHSGGHFVVREADAHAWIETCIEGAGWVEADPTPAAEYAEVHRSQPSALAAAFEWLRAGGLELWARLRKGDLRSLLRWLFATPFVPTLLLALCAAALARRRRHRPVATAGVATSDLPAELRRLVSCLDAAWAQHGQPRPAWRGLLEHAEAIPPEALPAELREAMRRAAECVYRGAYAGVRPDAREIADLATSTRR